MLKYLCNKKSFAILLLLQLFGLNHLLAQAGGLDLSFNRVGYKMFKIGDVNLSEEGQIVQVQPDGKILIVAQVQLNVGFSSPYNPGIIRLLPNGDLDTSFAQKGFLIDILSENPISISNLFIQSNGDLILCCAQDYGNEAYIIKYASDGKRVKTFGTNGLVKFKPAFAYSYMFLKRSVRMKNGDIVLAGLVDTFATVFRFDSTGSPVSNFGENGCAKFNLGGANNAFTDMNEVKDGKLMLVFRTESNFIFLRSYGLIKLLSNGIIDSTFGTDGKFFTTENSNSYQDHISCIQSDDKIVVAMENNGNIQLMRITENGELDNTYGNAGVVLLVDDFNFEYPSSLLIQPDGKLIVGGLISNQKVLFYIARLFENGEPDTTWGSMGIVNSDFGELDASYLRSLAIQKDGKILAVGAAYSSLGKILLARYRVNPIIAPPPFKTDKDIFVFPNPVTPESVLFYKQSQNAIVNVYLYDLQGRKVATLLNNYWRLKGDYKLELKNIPTELKGTYILQLATGTENRSIRVLLD